MDNIDPRIVRISIDVGEGYTKTYSSPFEISIYGMKYANQLQNECQITIENLDKNTQDYILTATSPYNLNYSPKYVKVEAGRESYGTQVIFEGNIILASVSQPPDIGITLKCLTGNYAKGNILSRMQGGLVPLSVISKQIANDLGIALQFEATDRNIPGYQYAGNSLGQVNLINSYGGINGFIDNGILVVKDGFVPLKNSLTEINQSTGMIGIPVFTEQGLRVTYLINKETRLGGQLKLTSTQYPAANGSYIIYKLGFQITSRDVPFYYVAECARYGTYQ
jgi:hypothetical protein